MGLLVPVQTLQVKNDVLGPLKIFVDYSLPDEKRNGTIICPYDKLSLISKGTFQFNRSKWRTILWCIYLVLLQKRQPLSLAILRPFLVIFLLAKYINIFTDGHMIRWNIDKEIKLVFELSTNKLSNILLFLLKWYRV